jgi:glycosyltransferase
MPHLTLITPTYNSAKTLSDTIESILEQIRNYPTLADNLDYIIMDGGSTDKTIEIVQRYQNTNNLNIKLISEPDKGIYDAMNKAILLAIKTETNATSTTKGANNDIVGIINSDDFYHDPMVLQKVIETFESDPMIDAVYGDLMYVQNDDITKQTRYWQAGEYKEENLNWGWSIPHPTFFLRKRIYQKLIEQNNSGEIFNTKLSLAADVELIFRLLKIYKIKVKYIPEILVTMRNNGTSANSLKQRIKGWREQRMVWKVNQFPVPLFFITRRLAHKIWQFIKLHR